MTTAQSGTPAVTIVVPTRDRPSRVTDCVRALLACMETFDQEVQIVVIDNGSSDAAAARVARLGSCSGSVRVITDPRPGVSRARNRGLGETRSAVVAFIDDDVIVEPGWLDALCAPFAKADVVGVVGRVELEPESARPDWLTKDLETWYSAVDLGDGDHPLSPGAYGWTANLAVRRDIAVRVGGFDEGLGPGRRPLYNEDLDFLNRLREVGTIWYAAAGCARHRIGAERLTRRWLLRRSFLQGRSNAALIRARTPSGPTALRPCAEQLLDAMARRWWRTVRRCGSRVNRDRALLEDGMRRLEALGFAWECSRAAIATRRRDR